MRDDDTQPTTPPVYQEPPSGLDMTRARKGKAQRTGKVETVTPEFDADAARAELLRSVKGYGKGT